MEEKGERGVKGRSRGSLGGKAREEKFYFEVSECERKEKSN